jgi:adenine-specific DNA-methyltransferase
MPAKKYGNPARAFELWNIGNYETVYWQDRADEYLSSMLKLYQSQALTGFRYLYGRNGDKAVHTCPLNAPVTMEEMEKVDYEARHLYKDGGEYQIMVKVVDVFGNDTNKVPEVRVK